MASTNISIKQSTGVAINVAALKAITVETLQAIKQHCNVGAWSLPRLYRQELRMARAVAAWCDRHNTLVNWLMVFQVTAFAFYVFLFA